MSNIQIETIVFYSFDDIMISINTTQKGKNFKNWKRNVIKWEKNKTQIFEMKIILLTFRTIDDKEKNYKIKRE